MRIQWSWNDKKRWLIPLVAVVMISQLLLKLILPKHPMVYVVVLAVTMGAFVLLSAALRFEIRSWWGMLLVQILIAGLAACVLHMPMYHHSVATFMALFNSALIFLALQLVLFAFIGSCKPFGAVLLTVCWIYGIVEYEVFEFTENLISIGQILSVRTGISVMNNYRFVMGPFMPAATILYVCAMASLLRVREVGTGRLRVRCVALGCAALAAVMPVMKLQTVSRKSWKSAALYHGVGIPLELLLELRDYNVAAPEGYSEQTVARLAEYAPDGAETPTAAGVEKPTIIAIMFEAFSDLSVLGNLQTNVDPLSCTHALASESVHGSYLASTLAGGTSRTEWEFLTGHSMFFLPGDSVPFKQYVRGEATSVVHALKNQGYHTIGMHCYDGHGWDRYRVYPLMGFDDIYFKDDLQWDGKVRDYVSDSAFVHQVIQLYEARDPEQPLFLFGVSMQNHGGYTYEGFEADVRVEGLKADCSQENQYLSLTKLTDDAIRELIDYFRGVDEPVEVVFFGDHQPGLTREFYSEVGMKQYGQKYIVPYAIWKNYDDTAEETPLTSANFLAARMLREAGLPLPAYFAFLDEVSGTVPALCALGYQYDGNFYDRDAIPGEAVGEKLREYETFQYAAMFDESINRSLYDGAGAQ